MGKVMVTLDERKSNVLLLTCWSKKYYLLRVTIFGYFSKNFLMFGVSGNGIIGLNLFNKLSPDD